MYLPVFFLFMGPIYLWNVFDKLVKTGLFYSYFEVVSKMRLGARVAEQYYRSGGASFALSFKSLGVIWESSQSLLDPQLNRPGFELNPTLPKIWESSGAALTTTLDINHYTLCQIDCHISNAGTVFDSNRNDRQWPQNVIAMKRAQIEALWSLA